MCLNNYNALQISHQGNPSEVERVEMSSLSVDVLSHNRTADCLESTHVDAYDRGIVFVDTASH